MKYGSLFSGIGGFDLGFDRAGMQCAWQVEIDDKARSVLSKHWPDVRKYDDVRTVGIANLEPVDLICGGFPCQDLSVAGKRAGLDGERSGLWFEFHRILAELKPEWVVIENVPGLLSSNRGADFAIVLRGLVELRYGVCWRVLDAQHFGVAQRRRRVFIVGHLGDGRAAEILFEREGMPGNSPKGRKAGQGTTADAISGTVSSKWAKGTGGPAGDETYNLISAALTGSPYADNESHESKLVVSALDTRNYTDNGDLSGTLQSKKTGGYSLNYQNPIAIKIDNTTSNGWGVLEDGTSHTLGGATDAVAIAFDPNAGDDSKWADRKGGGRKQFIRAGDYSGALSADGNVDAVAATFGVRRLTPIECERLQGFPDGWTAGQADSARYKQLGNAVAVPVAAWIGSRIAGL